MKGIRRTGVKGGMGAAFLGIYRRIGARYGVSGRKEVRMGVSRLQGLREGVSKGARDKGFGGWGRGYVPGLLFGVSLK